MSYKVNMQCDSEAAVWIATSQDVPGLVLESGSFDALLERVRYAIPELLELNGNKQTTFSVKFLTEREDLVAYG